MSILATIHNALGGYKPLETGTELAKLPTEDEDGPSTNGPDIITEICGMTGLSLHEKKCILINHEIDAMGMGRYQWCLWLLCGLGYFLGTRHTLLLS